MFHLLYLILLNIISSSYVFCGEICPPFRCGNDYLSYPFWSLNDSLGYCGYEGLGVNCSDEKPILTVYDRQYWVRSINYSDDTAMVVDLDFTAHPCGVSGDYRLLPGPGFKRSFDDGPNTETANFYTNCSSSPASATYFSCNDPHKNKTYTYFLSGASNRESKWYENCTKNLMVPVVVPHTDVNIWNISSYNWPTVLTAGFQLLYYNLDSQCKDCEESGGQCRYHGKNSTLFCICSKGTKSNHPYSEGTGGRLKKSIIIGISAGVGSLFLLILITLLAYRRKSSSFVSLICVWSKKNRKNDNVKDFLKNYGHLAPHKYTYSDIKKITNGFKDKLGQGGYGGVFKGKLKDGSLVAVKLLNESKGNGDEFINEVATIGRTNHVNIVGLLGFCSEGSKRALVYEFMPNGSLEKFIYDEKSTSKTHPLGCEKLYQIALGIANGLEYLHRGCNTRILHFDIKPHNILLDKDFCPKIADFGLAKLCLTREDVVSMLNARGTIGYIAPEVYQRNLGGVSSKSDVYSYGMMLLEMVGGRKNIDISVDNTSEIYFPEWIYNHLKQRGNIGLESLQEQFSEENIKKMIIVGLWCIQTHPRNRPAMSLVVDMLQKRVDELLIPPNPFLDSPKISQPPAHI